MKKAFLFIPFLSGCLMSAATAVAQKGNWNVYMAQYEEGPGSVTLDMDLIAQSPQADKPFIVITGVTCKNCREDGFPESEELEKLYQIADEAEAVIAARSPLALAGTFTLKCERLSYLYLRDTTGIRQALAAFYKEKYSDYAYSLNIKEDKEWKAYRDFLYPNEVILEDMSNRDVLINLMQAGDDLSRARQVDHWLYFSSEKDRSAFISDAKKQGYKIEGKEKSEGKFPFTLRISRTDHVDPASINAQTLALKKEALKHKGQYDGWETFVIKQ